LSFTELNSVYLKIHSGNATPQTP